MQAAAAALTRRLDELTAQAMATRYDDAAAKRAIATLTDAIGNETNDFASARQMAWAIRELAVDLNLPDASTVFRRGSDAVLALDLPSGQDRSVIENLSRWLPAAARYDAEWFRAELQVVRAKLVP